MKARIKETREIVEVEDLFDDGTAFVNGKCLKGYIKVSKLNLFEDFDDKEKWQQVRIQAAIAAMQGILFGYTATSKEIHAQSEELAKCSVILADALVDELRIERSEQ